MPSVYVICWIVLQIFQTCFCIQANMWTLIRLLLEEQSDEGPHCLQKRLKVTSGWQSRRQLLWLAVWENAVLLRLLTWVHYYEPENKAESRQWVGPRSPRQPSAGKVMATVFWDANGVIMLDFLPKRSAITGVYYANLLNQLRTAIHEKRRGKLSKDVLLQQDNARVHTCKVAMDAVERNRYELIPHPAYSPDLAPSDFFLFPNLKKDIHGLHFQSDEEVVPAVEEWVSGKDPDFFSSGLMALEHR